MRKIIKIMIIICLMSFVSCKAQTIVDINTYNQGDNSNKYFKDINNNYANFIGTWECTTGTTTFRVILWKETKRKLLTVSGSYIDEIYGKFLLIENKGMPNEEVIHNSVKYFPQSNVTTNWVILGSTSSSSIAYGDIEDNCANGGNDIIRGGFKMTISNMGSTPLSAHWEVKSERPLNTGESFTIPTDCILTKQ